MKFTRLAICGFVLGTHLLTGAVTASADSYPPAAMFNLADRDRDGSLSRAEWKQLIHASASAFSGKSALCFERSRLPVFDALDRNRDGRVSRAEWRLAGTRQFDPSLPDCS
jgi:hypothetical protein